MSRIADTRTPAAAYASGRLLHEFGTLDRVVCNHRAGEARAAVDAWTTAAADHAHTSYYGAAHIRAMRAFWLGVLRTLRGAPTDPKGGSA